MEFTALVIEVKLMAQNRGIRIHLYLDLVRATSHQTCLYHTQTRVAMCQELGWIVDMEISIFVGYQIFNLYRLPVRPQREQLIKVRPTL